MPIGLNPDVADALISYLDRERDELARAIVTDAETPDRTKAAVEDFAGLLLQKIRAELSSGDPTALDVAAASAAIPERTFDAAALLTLACATVASSFLRDRGATAGVVRYFSRRGDELVREFDAARSESRQTTFGDAKALVPRDELVNALVTTIEANDPATGEHSRAVGAWSARLAQSLGLSAEAQSFATLCGTLHDVGKIVTPAHILRKPAALDDAEWVQMRAHARAGAMILERIPSLRDVAPIVLAHHERPDGRGYPEGARGSETPLIARIVAVADAFHAMISKRPYRDPFGVPEAAEHLLAGRGTQWDAVVVDAVIGLVRPVPNTEPRESRLRNRFGQRSG